MTIRQMYPSNESPDSGKPEEKYIAHLRQLHKAFEKNFPPYLVDPYDRYFVLSQAWNFANMHDFLPPVIFKDRLAFIDAPMDEKELIDAIIRFKVEHFPDASLYINLQDVSENGKELNIETLSLDEYMALINEGIDEDWEEEDSYEDRQAITLVPKEPFRQWIMKVMVGIDLPPRNYGFTFLIDPEIILDEDWFQETYIEYFEELLERWADDKRKWPRKRSFELFQTWFDYYFSAAVFDKAAESFDWD